MDDQLTPIRVYSDKVAASQAAAEFAAGLLRGAISARGRARLVGATGESQMEFLRVLLSLLEPAVRDDLATEHERLADDLALLEWLLESAPESPDVTALADSLIPRMREHVSRDGRLLEQAARIHSTSPR